MTSICDISDTFSDATRSDCSPFLNWDEESLETIQERSVVFRSLVATVKLKPALEASLEAKAKAFLKYMDYWSQASVDQIITTTTMRMLNNLFWRCSAKVRLALFITDMVPQLISTINPLSLSFVEAADIHVNLMKVIFYSLELSTPNGLEQLEIEDGNEKQAVHETVLMQIIIPSEKYICHLCTNRNSIIDGEQSESLNLEFSVFRDRCPAGMERKKGRCATDGEDSVSNAENGGHGRCD
ncbi:hypothetical protein BLNAU_16361 [Blattamonas nauphoetae]|uniref:Uncharacterized protein n=1 Tax=Blattamonas nauphoetae TaxID=2049346 RepID=A0ABQ9XBT2_9EUKA|nr:hypothetical protein BLNAU_16361 [Blattamonas nauphoetae]